ncbi:chromosomal replication initiator DnaA [Roseovarius sp. LXJ103]|uniref:chromosomal replication initiator DnaA n=1 Tax=Roseovarius carneus TaxID=2853164 RepID=UPI000D60A6A7|nr:chromosomal replication initiator DnaA [Roseovarius carneus]MBZ8118987.1 chromosomal replication initiator DnaA [Roseovarius carneus]PWE35360.1 chromosomal replication initiator DnaA [Pelagicola sp. LXJ1103]
MAYQLSLDLPARPALGRGDFFVSGANAAAVAMIEGWENWPARKLVLHGATGSGKTHLTHVWAALSGAEITAATDLTTADIPALASAPVAVEDADRITGTPEAEHALFHLHNLCLAEGHSLLITARTAPSRWALALPDLASRMEGTPAIGLDAPDDALLSAVILKQMADRQIIPTPGTIPFLARRMPRSFAAVADIVAALDRAALAQKRPVTRKLAAEILDKSGA